jgi:hypothetical protein
MELYLQFGYGMMEHCRELLGTWGGGVAVLSPRELNPDRLPGFAGELTRIDNTQVLVDPQFYLPHSGHERLRSHGFWPNEYESQLFWQGPPLTELLTELLALNSSCESMGFILPGMLATRIDDDWIASQKAILDEATSLNASMPLLSTIALAGNVAKDQAQVGALLEAAEKWNPAGYYVVCEHPDDYLVEDPNWLANVLDIIAGLRIAGKEVILGYANHQLLAAAVAKPTAICSGTWMNVRSFPPQKFQAAFDEEIRKRAKWYYCPQSLSEYKLPFLDIAHRQGVLDSMKPLEELDGGYVDMLFSGAQPSATDFSEQAAFRHYLHALHEQVKESQAATYDDTVAIHERALDAAEELLESLAAAGVRGQKRDFSEIVDVNRAALSVLTSTRGAMLRRRWPSL